MVIKPFTPIAAKKPDNVVIIFLIVRFMADETLIKPKVTTLHQIFC